MNPGGRRLPRASAIPAREGLEWVESASSIRRRQRLLSV
jgi:hypothetical protein